MVSVTDVRRGQVFLVSLDPREGHEITRTRPSVALSPDELKAHLQTCIVAPLTTGSFAHPFRVSCRFQGKASHAVLDQIRTAERARLVKKLRRRKGAGEVVSRS